MGKRSKGPSPGIDAAACDGESFIMLTVRYLSDLDNDQNGNGVPDEWDPPVCQGREATVYVDRDGVVVGGRFDGRPYFGILLGTRGDDSIDGGEGFDIIHGNGGVDTCINGERTGSCENGGPIVNVKINGSR